MPRRFDTKITPASAVRRIVPPDSRFKNPRISVTGSNKESTARTNEPETLRNLPCPATARGFLADLLEEDALVATMCGATQSPQVRQGPLI